jgi:hypothetical protein
MRCAAALSMEHIITFPAFKYGALLLTGTSWFQSEKVVFFYFKEKY